MWAIRRWVSTTGTSTNAADKDLNIELMNEQAAMLADVGDQVSLMKPDLADLLRGLKP